MSERSRQAADELESIVKQGGKLLDAIEARGRRFDQLPTGALNGVVGLCAGYLSAYLLWIAVPSLSFPLVGTLAAGLFGALAIRMGRNRAAEQSDESLRLERARFEMKVDHSRTLLDFAKTQSRQLGTQDKERLVAEACRLLINEESPAAL